MKQRIKTTIAITFIATILASAVMPAYADETEQYPLKGTFPYTLMTKEIVDQRLADGWVFAGDPYGEVGTATPFQNNMEWAQVNNFKSSVSTEINASKILITLAGLTSATDSYSGTQLTTQEEAVKDEVVKYLNSYDWKNASEYEKAFYTALYIADNCEYHLDTGSILEENSSYSCLVKGKSRCDGFAATYHLLTRAVGLKSVHVSDRSLEHAWNYVMIGNEWYEMDVTFIASSSNHQDRAKQYLNKAAINTTQYLWTEMGVDLDFDSTLRDQPMY